jgi:arylsulfatase A-like enzyme
MDSNMAANRFTTIVGGSLRIARFILCCGAMLIAANSRLTAAERPNFVFILADDLGWSDLGCYGSSFHETPHIDRLASEGLRFTQAYTAGAVCSPTRGSIMTGKYPVRTGVTDYIPGLPSDGRKLTTPRTKTELALEEVTLGEAMRDGGYQTFYAGKWHLGKNAFDADAQGFEIYAGDDKLGNYGQDWMFGDRMTAAALTFLKNRDSARPFFMYLAYHEPHTPILEYPSHIERLRAKAAKLPQPQGAAEIVERDGRTRVVQNDPAYASEVAGLDDWVGRVLNQLDQTGLAQNTIVVFFSDNGGLSTKAAPGPTSNQPLRAGKGWLYEGGIRVPLIVRAPGMTKPGTFCESPVISTDLYPTLLALAGLPLRPRQHLDGVSIAPLLSGGPAPNRQTFFWHYPHYHGSTWAPGSAVRNGDWKLIEFFEENSAELYNLNTDIGERKNLAAEHPERVKSMRAQLAAWRSDTGAIMPQPNPSAGQESAQKTKKSKKRPAKN